MAGYTLIASSSTRQVLSQTATQDAVLVTIQTDPSQVVATTVVSRVSFDNNQSAEELTALAGNIEIIMSQGKAIGGTGTSDLDNNGLTEYFVTFTVGYNPPGAPPGQVTVDVDIPIGLLEVDDPAIERYAMQQAEAKIDAAYSHLQNLAAG